MDDFDPTPLTSTDDDRDAESVEEFESTHYFYQGVALDDGPLSEADLAACYALVDEDEASFRSY